MLARQIRRPRPGLGLLQHTDDLTFREPCSLHLSVLQEGRTLNPRGGKSQWQVSLYRQRTPIEFRLAESFDRHWRSLGGQIALDEAQVDEIPDPERFTVKNTATLALQLLKRFRNIRYADYAGRIPPSVVLSYYAALSARPNTRLCDMVIRIATWILGDIEDAVLNRRLLHVSNPLCPDDVFTDRWPESMSQQVEFAHHLKDLVQGLAALRRSELSADAVGVWLRNHFGARVVTKAADHVAQQMGCAIHGST